MSIRLLCCFGIIGAVCAVGMVSAFSTERSPHSNAAAPNWSDWNELGRAKAHRRDFRGAIAAFDQAIALNPTSAMLRLNRGGALLGMNELQAALEELSRGIALDPAYPELRLNRAQARAGLGDWAGAVEDLDIALKLTPPSWPYRAFASDRLEEARRKYSPRRF